MKTILGTEIPEETRGILYLCLFNGESITVFRELFFKYAWNAINAYAEIPNPESQVVTGKNYTDLCENLLILHTNMKDKKWLKELSESI